MKHRIGFLVALVLFATCTVSVRAQIPPPPTPTPDPHTYSDPAMNYTAPPQAVLVARQMIALNKLSQDLQPVAEWVLDPGKDDARAIVLSMEAYDGPPNQWETQFESQTHSEQDGAFIRSKTPISLTNGMPAWFVEVAIGSGFQEKKEYAVVWADGQRGVVLAEVGRMGDVGAQEAKRVLHDVSAVAYPLDQP
jgi:hypothetical protein